MRADREYTDLTKRQKDYNASAIFTQPRAVFDIPVNCCPLYNGSKMFVLHRRCFKVEV